MTGPTPEKGALKEEVNQASRRVAVELAGALREHLFEHILLFWCGPALDQEKGGWMGWLSNDLKPDRSRPKGLIVHARILWTFSAVHRIHPDPVWRRMAIRAFDYLTNQFWDSVHGGAFWQLDDDATLLDGSKKTYGQAFCVYALSEYHRAFKSEDALHRARQLFDLVERYAHDPEHGGYVEVCNRDWSAAAPDARLSEKDMCEKKSMNNHLHLLEAWTNLHRVSPDPLIKQRLRELIELFLNHIVDPATNHLRHFFNEVWNVRSDTYTFGHDIEASWLLCEAAEELGDDSLLLKVRAAALEMAGTVLREGMDRNGGLWYEGKAGSIVDAGKECWPQAEAIVGFVNAWQLSHDPGFLEAAWRNWEYASHHLVDRQFGEWFWRINEDGQPDASLPKVSEWKGPYHVSRACLEVMRRLG